MRRETASETSSLETSPQPQAKGCFRLISASHVSWPQRLLTRKPTIGKQLRHMTATQQKAVSGQSVIVPTYATT